MAARRPPSFFRSNTKRWSEVPVPGGGYAGLADEIAAAQRAGWSVTGVYCSSSSGFHGDTPFRPTPRRETDIAYAVDRILVGFAKPAADLDHAAAAYLFEELWEQPDEHVVDYSVEGRIVVGAVAPHHADKGWPAYQPVPLADTCIADPSHPRLPAEADMEPKANPPPPKSSGYGEPLDESGKPFITWDYLNRSALSALNKPDPSSPTVTPTR
ncbi:hypothetical protein [Segniliparus rugosus]|uniref:hypothetical protein n=1 Tax=Segniliparus rugosus TaxID=286804 RepID=UPI0003114492|nr:hypothetical protein [Segniliparus rugosus]